MSGHRKKGGAKEKKTDVEEEPTVLIQPKRSYAEYDDTTCKVEITKDFESLIKASTSAGGQFAFKSEKNWIADVSDCFEYFTLDMKLFSAAINSIPFNECVEIEDEYFTADQLMKFHNEAEEGKEAYKQFLQASQISDQQDLKKCDGSSSIKVIKLLKEGLTSTENQADFNSLQQLQNKSEDDNAEDDIDFLLSLDSPINQSVVKKNTSKPLSYDNVSASKIQSDSIPARSRDLERWLDSILED